MARMHVHFDLLNHMSRKSVMSPLTESESHHAVQALDELEDDMLTIYDRGYAGFAFMYLNIIKKKHFAIRYPAGFCNEIKAFEESASGSSILTFKAGRNAVKRLQSFECSAAADTEVQARAVKVRLDNGETGILVTSLLDEASTGVSKIINLFYDPLYSLTLRRWGVFGISLPAVLRASPLKILFLLIH